MYIQQCEHPRRIKDKITGKFRYVACGKCNACRCTRQAAWVSRIEDECKCWPYSIFFTLTYDDAHVPTYSLTREDVLVSHRTGEVIDLSSLPEFDGRSRQYVHRRHNIYGVSVDDCQKFIKRLRYYISNLHLTDFHSKKDPDYEKVRYYLVSEYGETTLRPHYHGILWTQSKQTAALFDDLLHKAWPFGRVDWSLVQGSASGYVASYVNCVSCCPKIYNIPQLRPFALCSKQPPIGSLLVPNKEIFQVFDRGTVEVVRARSGKNVYLPIGKPLENSLFPKVQGYSTLSHYDRVFLYGIARYSGKETFHDFQEWCESLDTLRYPSVCSQGLAQLKYIRHAGDPLTRYPLKSLWSVSQRVCTQALLFDCTIDYYVSRIENYYSNKELVRLSHFYQFQEAYTKANGSAMDLINMYDLGLDYAYRHEIDSPRFLQSFGLTCDIESIPYSELEKHKLESLPIYKSFVGKFRDITKKSRKTKRKNDYLAAHPELTRLVF